MKRIWMTNLVAATGCSLLAASVTLNPSSAASARPSAAAAPAASAASSVASASAAAAGPTEEQIRRAIVRAGGEGVRVRRFTTHTAAPASLGTSAAVKAPLPGNLFSISSTWADWYENGKKFVAFYGRWNYRDDKIGSGAPYDAAGMALEGFNKKCWTNVSTGLTTQDSAGKKTKLSSLKSSSHAKSIWNVHDRTSGFRLQTDMGFAWIQMKKTGRKKCGGRKVGGFHHVHNQGGKGGFSASVNLGVLNLSYDGKSPSLELKKSAKISYYN